MKKIKTALSLCSIFLLFACTTDDLNQDLDKKNAVNNESTIVSKYIDLQEFKKDSYSFVKFQQMEADLDILRNSKNIDNNQFVFLINTEKILLNENDQSKTFTFPIHRSANNQVLENLVLKINSNGDSESYLIKYNLTDSDKSKIKNREVLNLENKTEVLPLSNLLKTINSKSLNNVTKKGILYFNTFCYELVAIKIESETSSGRDHIVFEYLAVACVGDLPSPPTSPLIDPITFPEVNTDPTYYPIYEEPYSYSQLPYYLGDDFSSYPVLDDPIETNNISARYFFDSLTYTERKWALHNGALYKFVLEKLTEKNWEYSYEHHARNAIWQLTQYHICNPTILTYEIEEDLFYKVMAGATLITVNETCFPI